MSWAGLLNNPHCADGVRVKWWRSSGPSNNFHISDKLPANTTTFSVTNLIKYEEYTYKVG